jgi:hypothetical protein
VNDYFSIDEFPFIAWLNFFIKRLPQLLLVFPVYSKLLDKLRQAGILKNGFEQVVITQHGRKFSQNEPKKNDREMPVGLAFFCW